MADPTTRPPSTVLVAAALLIGVSGAVLFAYAWFAGGGALLLLSVVALRRSSFWRVAEPAELDRRTRLLLLLAVAAVAAFYRTYRMVPPGLWGDDAMNGLIAYDVLDGKVTSPFQLVRHSASYFPALSNYPIAAAFWAFGPSMTMLRLPGVVLNFLCVLLLYGTVAPLFRIRAALVAALFFAVSPMQIQHGTTLVQAVTGEFLLMLGICSLVRGLAGSRRWLVVLAGIPLGLSLCTYHTFKLGPLIAVVYGLAVIWERRGERLRLLGWCSAGFLLLAAAAYPGFISYANDPSALTGRISGTSILAVAQQRGSLAPLWDSIWRTLAIFHYQQGPVLYHWFGIGTDPALDAIVAALVLHGLGESLLRWKQSRHQLLLVWFAVGIVPGLLSVEAPRVYRILLATPPVFVWAALPVERLLAWSIAAPRRSGTYGAIAGLILAIVPLVDFNDYFVRTRTHPDYLWMQASRMVDMARTLKSYGPEWKGYLVASGFDSSHESFAFLRRLWNLQMQDVTSLTEVMPRRDEDNVLLIFDPPSAPMADEVQPWYPGSSKFERHQPVPQLTFLDRWLRPPNPNVRPKLMAAYLPLPRSAAAARRGLDAVYLDAADMPVASQRWSRLAPPPVAQRPDAAANAARAIVSGAFYAPRSGRYRFVLGGAGAGRVGIDGRVLLTPTQRSAEIELAQGLHSVGAEIDVTSDQTVEVGWQPPGEPPASIPPSALYADVEVAGWLAEYDNGNRTLRRIEPLPWYQIFARTFEDRYRVLFRGRLRVPEGGRVLSVRSRGETTVTIDGKPWDKTAVLPAGDRDVELVIDKVEGGLLLELLWHAPGRETERVPAAAFLLPRNSAGDAG